MKRSIAAKCITLLLCALFLSGCGRPAPEIDTGVGTEVNAPGMSIESFCEQYEGLWMTETGEFVDIWFVQDGDDYYPGFGWGCWNSDTAYTGRIENLIVAQPDIYDLTICVPARPETEMQDATEAFTITIRVDDTDNPDNSISMSFDGSQYVEYVLDGGPALYDQDGWYWDFLCNREGDCYWTNPDTQDYVWFSEEGYAALVVFGNWQNDNNRGFGEILLISVWPEDHLEMTIYFPEVAADNEAGFWPETYICAQVAVDVEQDEIYIFVDSWEIGQTYYRAQG